LLKLYAQLLLTVDGLWFVGTEKTMGVDSAIKFDKEVWRRFGELEANRMKKFLGMEHITTVEDICKIVLISPMWVSVKYRKRKLRNFGFQALSPSDID
jgi:hypothetical protein